MLLQKEPIFDLKSISRQEFHLFILLRFHFHFIFQKYGHKAGYIIIWVYKSFKQTSLIADQIHYSS